MKMNFYIKISRIQQKSLVFEKYLYRLISSLTLICADVAVNVFVVCLEEALLFFYSNCGYVG